MSAPIEKRPPPRRITFTEAARYVRSHHHTDLTRQSVYNWAKVGVKGVKLKFVQVGRSKRTTKEWVDAFLNDTAKL